MESRSELGLDRYCAKEVREALVPFGFAQIEVYDEIDSTQARARALVEQVAPGRALVVAARQTCGRGRQGRTWSSPGGGLWFSLVLAQSRTPLPALPLTVPISLAVARAVERLTTVRVGLKWPNDLFVEKGANERPRKLAGVLVDGVAGVFVAGVGINAANPVSALDMPVRDLATSLVSEETSPPARLALLVEVLRAIDEVLPVWRKQNGDLVKEAWERSVLKGRRLSVQPSFGDPFEANAIGLGRGGALRIKLTESGEERSLVSGRVGLL
jgi:BirA family transcriptional regulator, biotin operon repressor / biotin---[acetyl-CoA-carboxylase] ligase